MFDGLAWQRGRRGALEICGRWYQSRIRAQLYYNARGVSPLCELAATSEFALPAAQVDTTHLTAEM